MHLSVEQAVGVFALEAFDGLVYVDGGAFFVAAEVGVAYHGGDGLLIEEADGFFGKACYVVEGVGSGVSVDEGVGYEMGALLGVEYVHGGEVVVAGSDADDFFGGFDGVAVFGV